MEEKEATLEIAPITEGQTHEAKPKDKCRISCYLKEHPGALVTLASAMVAIVTFAINYASNRYHVAYLEYWNIDAAYCAENSSVFYSILWAFLYCVAILIIHTLLSETSEEFRYYNKFLSVVKWEYKEVVKLKKEQRKIEREYNAILRICRSTSKYSERLEELRKKISSTKEKIASIENQIREAEEARKRCNKWVVINIVLAVVVSCFIGVTVLLLSQKSLSLESFVACTIVVLLIVLLDMLLYFLPAYWATRCTSKSIEKLDLDRILRDMEVVEAHNFPLGKIISGNISFSISDSKISMVLSQLIVSFVVFMIMVSLSGTNAAKNKEQFPIYQDDQGTYAVVYNTGDIIIMESAHIEGAEITIDTSEQRIVTEDDISYQIMNFEHVNVLDAGGEEP